MSILSPEEQDAAAAMYNHLVTPSGTKIAHRAGDLARYASVDEAQAGTVLDRLARERIIRAAEDGAAGPQYEIFHDVLADAVLAWRTQHEADRRLAEERREGARRHRRLLALAGGSLVVVAVLAGVAAYALSQRGSAQDRAREAEASAREADANDLAALAEAAVARSPERSLSLALEASEKARTPTVENALRSALGALRTTRVIDVGRPIANVTFSPDGALLAAAPDKGTGDVVSLYASDGSRLVGTRRGTDVSFGPRGRRLVTVGRSAVVSDVKTNRRIFTLRHPAGVLSASFSPDSSLIATTSPDRRVRLWDARTGRLLHVLPGSDPDTVSSQAAFDRSSRRLVTWGGGPAALIYDVLTGNPTARLLHRGHITVARFSPTADVLATGGGDKVARLWDAATGLQLRVFRGHVRGLLDLAFSDSGALVATASSDGTARVWDPRYATLVAILPGHVGFVTALDFSPDGELIATASRDRMARIFDADSGTLRATLAGHEEAVRDVAFGADGRTVATGSPDGTVRLWNAQPFPELRAGRRATDLRRGRRLRLRGPPYPRRRPGRRPEPSLRIERRSAACVSHTGLRERHTLPAGRARNERERPRARLVPSRRRAPHLAVRRGRASPVRGAADGRARAGVSCFLHRDWCQPGRIRVRRGLKVCARRVVHDRENGFRRLIRA